MSAGGRKGVERFDCTSGGAQFCNGCYTMTPDSEGEYVRHEDFAELEQQRAALVEALKKCSARLEVHMIHTEDLEDLIAHMESIAALRAAGVEL